MRPSDKITLNATIIFPFLLLFLFANVLIFDPQINQALLAPGAVSAGLQVLAFYQDQAPMPEIFDQREQEHLADVKQFVRGLQYLTFVLLVVFLALLPWTRLGHVFVRGFVLLVLIAAILAFAPFDIVFERFHALFFPAGSWVFAPESTLIQLYPFSFFQQFFLVIIQHALLFGAVLALFGSLLQHHKA